MKLKDLNNEIIDYIFNKNKLIKRSEVRSLTI